MCYCDAGALIWIIIFFPYFSFLFFVTTSSCQQTWNWLSQSNKRTFIGSETRNDYFTPNMLYGFDKRNELSMWNTLSTSKRYDCDKYCSRTHCGIMINDEMCRFSRVFRCCSERWKRSAKEADDMEWNWWKCANWLGSIKTEMSKCELFFLYSNHKIDGANHSRWMGVVNQFMNMTFFT